MSAILPLSEILAPTRLDVRRENGQTLILLVDDDAHVRRLVRAVLSYAVACSELGADVIEAPDYDTALSTTRSLRNPIDLLISDIHLGPGKSGLDLAREMSLANPRMRVLLMSGNDVDENSLPSDWRFLAKPFPVSDLVNYIISLCAYNLA